MKAELNADLRSREFASCEIAAIEFSGPLSLATTGTLTPDVDLDGTRLQTIHDTSRGCEWLSVAVDSTESGGAVVFGWLCGAAMPRRFVESILSKENEAIPQLIVQLLLFYIENSFFSSSWWSGLAEQERSHLRALAVEPHSYYAPRRLRAGPFVPWSLVRVHRFGTE